MRSIFTGLRHYFSATRSDGAYRELTDAQGNAFVHHLGIDGLALSTSPLFATENTIQFAANGTSSSTIQTSQLPIGALNGPTGGTISLWFKETTGTGHGSSGGSICYRRHSSLVSSREYHLGINTSAEYRVVFQSSAGTTYGVSSLIPAGTTDWHHAIFGFDPASVRGFISVDGERIRYTDVFDTGRMVEVISANRFALGASSWTNWLLFNGHITQPIIWDRALTQEEMLYLYNDGQGRSRNQIFAPMEQEYDVSFFGEPFSAGGIPTLTFPGVIDITATSARPQVTLTY